MGEQNAPSASPAFPLPWITAGMTATAGDVVFEFVFFVWCQVISESLLGLSKRR